MINTPQIYVACLAAYNNGKLHGQWIDATQDIDLIWDDIKDMLKNSPIAEAEEWAIHDYDNFGCLQLGEYENIEHINNIALFIEKHEEVGIAVLEYFNDLEQATTTIEDCYIGNYKSTSHYAQEFIEETCDVPTNLAFYIDYEKLANDMEMNGDIISIERGFEDVYIFNNY